MNNDTLIIDGSSFIFRAFHARPLVRNSRDIPINAVEGLIEMVLKPIIEKRSADEVAIVFDHPGRNFRHALFPEYKANRQAPPAELEVQKAICRKAALAYGFSIYDVPGFEADDVIATLTTHALGRGRTVTISSSDKDLMQLIEPRVRIYDHRSKRILKEPDALEKFGVSPSQVPDVQALMGDASDGIPGARGIGPKIATRLIQEFTTLENLLERISDVSPERTRQLIREAESQIKLSKTLATLRRDVTLETPVPSAVIFDSERAKSFIDRYDIRHKLIPRLK